MNSFNEHREVIWENVNLQMREQVGYKAQLAAALEVQHTPGQRRTSQNLWMLKDQMQSYYK